MTREEIRQGFIKAKRKLFDKVYSERLNPEQCDAVFSTEGPLLVLAGAGSGKTTVLVNRIVFLIKYGNAYFSEDIPEGVDEQTVEALNMAATLPADMIEELLPQFITDPCPPWQVLAFTFTNKAAGEIKARLLSTFNDEAIASSIWAGTFHSICVRILRKYADRVGLKEGFTIYDEDDSRRMIAKCMKELNISEDIIKPRKVSQYLSNAKNELIGPEDYETTLDAATKLIAEIYPLYQKRLQENNAVDFDDIIMKVVNLLENDLEVRSYYQRKFRYVLVDEYQDTNRAQFVLANLLSGGGGNLMVVGDDDQSIYRFRGATIENILRFDKVYPTAKVIRLEQNYRSTANILAVANSIIANNDDRHEKKLWCDKGEGAKITVKQAKDPIDEGKYIVEEIVGAVRKQGKKYSDFAVLYRMNMLGRTVQTAFAKSGVPFRVVGDMGFYDRKEIKDMIAYLSVISFPGDNLRLARIINEPKRKIGDTTVAAIEELAIRDGVSMYDVIERSADYPILSKSRDKLQAFAGMMNEIRENYYLPSEILEALFEKTGYHEMLEREGFEGEGKIDNVKELISAAVEYESKCNAADVEPTLLEFLEELALISSVDKYDENADAVVLMTVHAAKGLEFPTVFIAGMEDGIFPSESDRNSKDEMSEERRLAYVAVTRAKEKLYITYSYERMIYGRTTRGILSQFIREEVPKQYIEFDRPKAIPPRQPYGNYQRPRTAENVIPYNSELNRPVTRTTQPRTTTGSRAENFGVKRLMPGTRVSHASFGAGVILSSRDMGGDVLYEVRFDSGVEKKLMATYAKLKEI